jgi:hypothetical protein
MTEKVNARLSEQGRRFIDQALGLMRRRAKEKPAPSQGRARSFREACRSYAASWRRT